MAVDRGQDLLETPNTGWRMGFWNLFRKESGRWWRTPRWLVQSLVWLMVLDGLTAAVLFLDQHRLGPELREAQFQVALTILLAMAGLGTAIGGIIAMQDALIEEKKSGTAAWVLTKPLARPAFVLSKPAAGAAGLLITAYLIPGAAGYLLFGLRGRWPAPLPYFAGLGLTYLHLSFYIALALMLGAFLRSRGPLLGISFALLFGYQLFTELWSGFWIFMPWHLVMPKAGEGSSLALLAATGRPLPTWTPIAGTIGLIALFLALAVWRFGREEF